MYMMMAGRLHQVDKGAASGGWWVRGQAMITVRHHGQAAAGAGRVIISSWGGPANNIIMLVLQHYHYNYYCSMNGRVTHCSRMASSVKGRGVPLMSFLAGSCSTSPWKYDTASWMSASARLLHGQWCCRHPNDKDKERNLGQPGCRYLRGWSAVRQCYSHMSPLRSVPHAPKRYSHVPL